MSVTSKPQLEHLAPASGSLLIASIMSEICLRNSGGVDFGTPMPR